MEKSLLILEKQEIIQALENKNDTLTALNKVLNPVRARLKSLKREIICTHHHRPLDPKPGEDLQLIAFNPAGAPDRAGLFAEIDNLHWSYGAELEQARRIYIEVLSLEKTLARLQAMIDKQPPIKPKPQGELF